MNSQKNTTLPGLRLILMALILLLALSSCGQEDIQNNSSPPDDQEATTQTESDVEPAALPEREGHPYSPLSGYRFLDEYGPGRVVTLIFDFRPLEDHPEILERLPDEYSHIDPNIPVRLSVAVVDWNGDGEEDYLVCARGLGYDYTLFLSVEGRLTQIEAGASEGDQVGLLDSETNGFPDIAFSSSYYHDVWRYDGNDRYRSATPYNRTASLPSVSDRHNWFIEDGHLHVKYNHLDIVSPKFSHPYPYHMALTVDGLSDLLDEPLLWCVEEDSYAIRGFGPDADYAATYTFVGKLREDADTSLIVQQFDEDPIWPSDIQIAVTYLEIGLEEQCALLRAKMPYPGLQPRWLGEQPPYTFSDADGTGKELECFLTYIGQPGNETTAGELSNDYILQAALSRAVGSYHVDGSPDDAGYAPVLGPIVRSVQAYNPDHFSIILKEHVEAAARELFGERVRVEHHSITFTDEVGWEWHETEGVYTPPHFGSGEPDWAHVFGYVDNGDSYEVEAVFYSSNRAYTEPALEEQVIEEEQAAVNAAQPRLLFTITRNYDGTLTFVSMRYLSDGEA